MGLQWSREGGSFSDGFLHLKGHELVLTWDKNTKQNRLHKTVNYYGYEAAFILPWRVREISLQNISNFQVTQLVLVFANISPRCLRTKHSENIKNENYIVRFDLRQPIFFLAKLVRHSLFYLLERKTLKKISIFNYIPSQSFHSDKRQNHYLIRVYP